MTSKTDLHAGSIGRLDGFTIRESVDKSPEACRKRLLNRIRGVPERTLRDDHVDALATWFGNTIDDAYWKALIGNPTP